MKAYVKIILAIVLIAVISGGIIMFTKKSEKNTESNMNNQSNETRNNVIENESVNGAQNSNNTTENTTDANKTNTNGNTTTNYEENAKEQMAEPKEGETIAIIHVKKYGDITVKFFDNIAPKAVENFITHAKDGYYDGVIFHRVINEFMIQGGDPLGTGFGGESIWGKGFEEELSEKILPYRGSLCMASSGTGTSSLGSQFFITQAHYDEKQAKLLEQYNWPTELLNMYKKYGGYMSLYQGYTVFGQVIEGMDVVDNIAKTKTDSKDKPVEDVVIEKIEVKTYKK